MLRRRPPSRRLLATATACLAAAGTLVTFPQLDGSNLGAAAAARPAASPVGRVVAISVDGLNPDAISTLGRAGTPQLHRLADQGASTLNARTLVEATITLPNHAGMLTSTGVDRRRGGHGYRDNTDEDRTTLHRTAGRYVSSVFDVVHDHGGSTSLFTSKDKFAVFDRTWNRRHGNRHRAGRDKIDLFRYLEDEDQLVTELVDRLRETPDTFTFLHLSSTDKVGHDSGYMGTGYLHTVTAMDTRVGRVLDAVASDPSLASTTTVLLTSDHGGVGHHHGDRVAAHNYTVPFYVWGAHVTPGADLYGLNRGRRNPGESRVFYQARRQPIRNADLGNLASGLLGLPTIPGSTVGLGSGLRVNTGQAIGHPGSPAARRDARR